MPEAGRPGLAAPQADLPRSAARRTDIPGSAAPQTRRPGPRETSPRLVLAFDLGRRQIGVACGDTLNRTASALAAIANGNAGPRWELIDTLMRDWQAALLVVGLPYNVDGSESRMSRTARTFAAQLATRYALPVELIDERYSSLEATGRLKAQRQSGLRKRRVTKADVDSAAACVILERWFVGSP